MGTLQALQQAAVDLASISQKPGEGEERESRPHGNLPE